MRDNPENRGSSLNESAIAWLDRLEPSERFFPWVHYQEPHGPCEPSEFAAPAPAENSLVLPKSGSNSGLNAIRRYQWLGHAKLAGPSLSRDQGDRPLVAQVGAIPEERWWSLRIGDREIRQRYGDKPLELGFESANSEDQKREIRKEIDRMSKLPAELAPWPRDRRPGAAFQAGTRGPQGAGIRGVRYG